MSQSSARKARRDKVRRENTKMSKRRKAMIREQGRTERPAVRGVGAVW